jgi:4-alpha-glucanotransferase
MAPLFSLTSSRSWGIGELPDLVPTAAWLASAGFDRLMILPIGPVSSGDTSPYSAISSMAIDPIYIALSDVPDFSRAGGVDALDPPTREALASARAARTVHYAAVRHAKTEALSRAFDLFFHEEWGPQTPRAAELADYVSREAWWLDDAALYAAIVAATGLGHWHHWPPHLRDRDPDAMDEARRHLARDILRQQYLQWIAETQWQRAKTEAHAAGVTIFGDFPFMVSGAGPDVWVRPEEVMFDVSLGVPPDAFSATGQDWAMPTYRWDRIRPTDFAWMRARVRRFAALYDGCRVDHLVGLYRTYGRPVVGEPFFNPADESMQIAQGEAILRVFLASGMRIIAEDLGVVPPFVKASLERIGVPGCRVLRWERHWDRPGHPFIDPADYPANSVAMTGTHDTTSAAEWWTTAPEEERRALLALLVPPGADAPDPEMPWSDALRDAVLAVICRAASTEVFLPLQDVFGWPDRLNLPGTVGEHNWTWRLPWPVDRFTAVPEAVERADFSRALARASGRLR